MEEHVCIFNRIVVRARVIPSVRPRQKIIPRYEPTKVPSYVEGTFVDYLRKGYEGTFDHSLAKLMSEPSPKISAYFFRKSAEIIIYLRTFVPSYLREI